MPTWNDRVRVVEQMRRNMITGATSHDGWRIELRLSGDGEPERWDRPVQAAILGPPAVVDAIDAARGPFASREEAESAATRLAAALESAVARFPPPLAAEDEAKTAADNGRGAGVVATRYVPSMVTGNQNAHLVGGITQASYPAHELYLTEAGTWARDAHEARQFDTEAQAERMSRAIYNAL